MFKQTRYIFIVLLLTAVLLLISAYVGENNTGSSRHELSAPIIAPATVQVVELSSTPTVISCEPPCWMGIIPGKTTDSEARKVLEKLSDYRLKTGLFSSDGSGEPILEHTWKSSDSSPVSERSAVETQRGIVREIRLYPDKTFSLRSVVSQYGPPKKFYRIFYSVGAGPNLLGLAYPEKGLFFATDFADVAPTLNLDRTVVDIMYFAPTSWDKFLQDFFGGNYYVFYDWPSSLHP